jgi:hypothetical protein
VAVGVCDPVRTFAGRDGRGSCADADVRDKATRARVEDAQRVAGRRDGRAASASTFTERHERNHHSGSDHAGERGEKDRAALPRPSLDSLLCPDRSSLGRIGFDRRLGDRRRSNGRRRCLQECTVDRVGLRRRIRAELVGEQLAAALVHAQRLGAVSRVGVCLHQTAVSSLAKRRERDQFLGPLCRLPRGARTEARIGKDAQRALADVGEVASLLHDPRSVFTGQERPARQ